MKKIVGAVLATSLLASSAFAEISFSYTGENYFTGSGDNLKYETADRADCLSLTIKNETSGVVLDMDLDSTGLVKDSYYGWMDFALPTGSLELTAGCWTGRYVNRMKADAGDLTSADFELYKPGVINSFGAGKDSDNLTENKIALVAAYTLPEVLPGKLLFKAGLVKSDWRKDAKGAVAETATTDAENAYNKFSSGFVGEIAYRQDDLINVNLAVKSLEQNNGSVGLFVSPLMIENLSATVGFTYAHVNSYDATGKKWQNGADEIAFDLRARYKISDKFSVTTMHNISSGAVKASASEIAAGYKYFSGNTVTMWNMLNLTFQAADTIKFGCTLNNVINGFDKKTEFTGANVTVSPYCAIQASEKVAITTSIRGELTNVNYKDGKEDLKITVPVIFSFSL